MSIGPRIITVDTANQNHNLVELQTVKDELGIAATDSSQDDRLQRIITAVGDKIASDDVEGLGRPPWRQTYTEQLPGYGGLFLYLSRFPIESVTSVSLDGSTVDSTTYSIAGERSDRLYRELGWQWTAKSTGTLVSEPVPGTEELDYSTTYVAGWVMPGDNVPSGQVALPSTIQEAALITAIAWSERLLQSGSSAIKSESFDGSRIEYRDPSEIRSIPKAAQDLLRGYR